LKTESAENTLEPSTDASEVSAAVDCYPAGSSACTYYVRTNLKIANFIFFVIILGTKIC